MSEISTEAATGATNGPTKVRGRRQVKVGRVISDKMEKTVTVAVPKTVVHPLYHRYITRTSKFTAHDETNDCRAGDTVQIVSSRPLSKRKRWRVSKIVKRAE